MKMRAFIRTFKGQAWQAAQPRKADTRLKKLNFLFSLFRMRLGL
ncbi:hypothetical protein MCETARE7_00456 [Candidatus Nanopelagicaceae bacterium]